MLLCHNYCELIKFVISLFLSSQRNEFNRAPRVSVSLLGYHDYDDMYLMIGGERRSHHIGAAKLRKKKNKAGDMFCTGKTAPSPRHVKECLLLATTLRLRLLNDNKYGPGNRSHWAITKTRFPNLIKALSKEPNMGTRKRVSSLYQTLAG